MQDGAVERQIAQRRAQRLVEERLEAQRRRFGTVIPIGRDDYTREVTEASKEDEPGDAEARGTGVVCFLYKDGSAWCSSILLLTLVLIPTCTCSIIAFYEANVRIYMFAR